MDPGFCAARSPGMTSEFLTRDAHQTPGCKRERQRRRMARAPWLARV